MYFMSDGVKQFTGEVKQAVSEVAADIKDSVGEALEQGAQSTFGTPPSPQQVQQKQMEDQKKIAEARRKIAFYQQTAQEQQIVRQENKQKETERQQSEQQEAQEEKIEKIQTVQAPKKPGVSEAVLRSQAEFKPGKGVGG